MRRHFGIVKSLLCFGHTKIIQLFPNFEMKQNNSHNKSLPLSIFIGILLFFGIKTAFGLYQKSGITVFWIWMAILLCGLILLLEILLKKIMVGAVKPPEFTVIEVNFNDSLDNVDTVKLKYYDSELNKLGFNKIVDYAINEMVGTTRLYHHPEHNCFAEVGFAKDIPVFCSIIAAYEARWSLIITNGQLPRNTSAIMFAFLSLSRDIYKRLSEEPIFLFETFLVWNQEISKTLEVSILEEKTADFYFELNRKRRNQQKNSLMKKSISLCLIKMWMFIKKPKSEWLGDYRKLKPKQIVE